VLLITHRPEGLEHMDEIVRIDGGAIAPRLATT
jgi:ABC-type transport system involved in cytochrome bd biosynthesis fused ATPase/permease subunit